MKRIPRKLEVRISCERFVPEEIKELLARVNK